MVERSARDWLSSMWPVKVLYSIPNVAPERSSKILTAPKYLILLIWCNSRVYCDEYYDCITTRIKRVKSAIVIKMELITQYLGQTQKPEVNKKCGRFSFVDGRSISRSVMAYFIIFHTTLGPQFYCL